MRPYVVVVAHRGYEEAYLECLPCDTLDEAARELVDREDYQGSDNVTLMQGVDPAELEAALGRAYEEQDRRHALIKKIAKFREYATEVANDLRHNTDLLAKHETDLTAAGREKMIALVNAGRARHEALLAQIDMAEKELASVQAST